MDFGLTAEQQRLQHECRELAADFATRSAGHDRDASHPVENYDRLREHGSLALTMAIGMGRKRRQLSRPHDRLRSAGRRLPVDRARLQHARLGGDAAAAKPRGFGRDQAAHRRSRRQRAQADRRQFLRAGDHLADRRAPADGAGAARRGRLRHHRPQDVRLDAGGGRLLHGDGLSRRRDQPGGRDDPDAAARGRGARSTRTGTCSACAPRAATR